jgi:hypothetical protein
VSSRFFVTPFLKTQNTFKKRDLFTKAGIFSAVSGKRPVRFVNV